MINLKVIGAAALLAVAPVLIATSVDARPGGHGGGGGFSRGGGGGGAAFRGGGGGGGFR
ncbi:MAG TPA: BA14K family protein, partial [Afipia sp.]|nr:BA14K family protein [Afipia sp.]